MIYGREDEATRADVDCGYDLLRGTKDEKTP